MKQILRLLLISGILGAIQLRAGEVTAPDAAFLAELSAAGVLSAAHDLGRDVEAAMVGMTDSKGHPYRSYRWWIGKDDNARPVIHAMPPEAEVGWTPWERWLEVEGKAVHQCWVLFPLKKPSAKGSAIWYPLQGPASLEPLLLRQAASLEAQLRRARVDVAADVLGLDFKKTFIDTLTPGQRAIYQQFRWVVIPHMLGADQPVIYALPPMNRSDVWPWESWYTDGVTPQLHHVHYTAATPLAKKSWQEAPGALQRPAEIMGRVWYWHDATAMTPALAQPGAPAGSTDPP